MFISSYLNANLISESMVTTILVISVCFFAAIVAILLNWPPKKASAPKGPSRDENIDKLRSDMELSLVRLARLEDRVGHLELHQTQKAKASKVSETEKNENDRLSRTNAEDKDESLTQEAVCDVLQTLGFQHRITEEDGNVRVSFMKAGEQMSIYLSRLPLLELSSIYGRNPEEEDASIMKQAAYETTNEIIIGKVLVLDDCLVFKAEFLCNSKKEFQANITRLTDIVVQTHSIFVDRYNALLEEKRKSQNPAFNVPIAPKESNSGRPLS
jgi:hypothetical protein